MIYSMGVPNLMQTHPPKLKLSCLQGCKLTNLATPTVSNKIQKNIYDPLKLFFINV